jgi:hypothetical protein
MALHSSSYESMHQDHGARRPKRGKHTDAVALLMVAALAVIATICIPGVRARVNKFFPSAASKKVEMRIRVWANRQAGNYYCPDSHFFGRGTGTYLSQGDALTLGYQPVLGKYCRQADPVDSKSVVHTSERHSPSTDPAPSLPARPDVARR